MRVLSYIIISLLAMILIAGCSTTAGSNSSGTGADSGPWPSKPTRDIQQNVNEIVASAPLWISLKCELAEKESLALSIDSIELKSDKQKFVIAANKDITALNPSGVRFNTKLFTQIISSSSVKRYKYIQVKFKINAEGSTFTDDKSKYSLSSIETSLPLANWIPLESSNDVKSNLLQLVIKRENIIINKEKMTAVIKPEGISATPLTPAGAITGNVSTFLPSTKVIAIFNGTSLEMGNVVPESKDGKFTITGLPMGIYKLKIVTGADIVNIDKTVEVKDKTVDVKEIKIQQTSIKD